jgi:hypothetical protein
LRQQFRRAWGNVPNKHRGFVRVFQNAAQYTVLAIFSAAFHADVPVGFIADFSCVMQEIGAVRLSLFFMPSIHSAVISLTLRRDALSFADNIIVK